MKYKSFEGAREYVRGLGFSSASLYWKWSSSGARPSDIPSNPPRVYKRTSDWTSWYDYLGIKSKFKSKYGFRSFESSKSYIKSFGFRTSRDYQRWSKSEERPSDMPSNPNVVYRKTKEWISWSDFLNAKPYRHFKAIDYRGFNDSRSFVRSLNLSSFRDYARWSKTSNRPSDIPSDPYKVYRKTDEWISWDDYLGISHKFRSFHFARVYIRSLGLQTCDCYRLWAKSEDRPYDIPAAPYSYYRKTGEWISWPDFLGNKS